VGRLRINGEGASWANLPRGGGEIQPKAIKRWKTKLNANQI
jgi:hypothetical protein